MESSSSMNGYKYCMEYENEIDKINKIYGHLPSVCVGDYKNKYQCILVAIHNVQFPEVEKEKNLVVEKDTTIPSNLQIY